MKEIYKKIGYIKGLLDATEETSKEKKIFLSITEVLEELTDTISLMLENDDFDDEDDLTDDDFDEEYDYAFICPSCGFEIEVDKDTLENEEELICPGCGNIIPVCAEFAEFSDEDTDK